MTCTSRMDCAATEFFKDGNYVYKGEGVTRDAAMSRPNISLT